MPEIPPGEVFTGRVLEWHSEEGWGVLASDALPERVWAHFSVIDAEGFRELSAGQRVVFSAERAEQDEYHWRAVWVRPKTATHHRPDEADGPGYASGLDIDFDS
ncbi:cold shock domain-containing protein [Streptomyces coelicoflavus]|uniref:Cold shock domain-containing protein n=1 Tax=Streptomyces coelicoflavus TaxID=285562 RepID=A0A7K3PY07_9ACTN|nr:cold shock domain-containing protein [Streptomyces coelicoflavus]NEB14823.1 cold shock domain-containing protein [Streptomyces coelicoflavus]